jgi:DNA polymerase-3 subunit epsilon
LSKGSEEIYWKKVDEEASKRSSDIFKAMQIFETMEDFIVLDLETTGFCANRGDRIIEVAFRKYKIDQGDMLAGEAFNKYVNPGRPIPRRITNLTRISDIDVRDKPYIDELLPEIAGFISEYKVVGHNVSFDFRFLNAEMTRAGFDLVNPEKIIDTLKISRTMYGRNVKHRLSDCARREKVDEFDAAVYHSALHDVQVTAALFFSMVKKIVNAKD